MLEVLDAPALRRWCRRALERLGDEREHIDALNVFPVADADTGTNMFLTVEAACEAIEQGEADHPDDFAAAVRDLAHGAFLGARGNSGVILSQILRGMSEAVAASPGVRGVDGTLLAIAFVRAARAAYDAVAAPVEGTILTVVRDAAAAVTEARPEHLAEVVRVAHGGATESLARTPEQLPVLREHGVVDAGGAGLVVLLGALLEVVTGVVPTAAARSWGTAASMGSGHTRRPVPMAEAQPPGGPAYEVMYLLDATERSVTKLRSTLEPLGDSLLVVGGEDLWNVHVHVDDVGAAIEAGLAAGRPHRIRVTHLTVRTSGRHPVAEPSSAQRGVVLLVEGEGIAALARGAGASAVAAGAEATPGTADVLAAIGQCAAGEVVVVPAEPRLRAVADAAAQEARADGVRVYVVPVRAAVQALAALAVHDPSRRLDDDVVTMTAAAGATRFAAVTVAEWPAMTSVGTCATGDVLGLLDGDVVLISGDAAKVAAELLERLLGGGGELVTVVHGDGGESLAHELRSDLHRARPDVECVVYAAGATRDLLLIGVE